MMGPWGCFGGWMWMFPLFFFGLLLVVAIIMISRYGGVQQAFNSIVSKMPMQSTTPAGPHVSQQSETPMDILKKRYAQGEITREQFEEMKKNLEEN